VREAFNEINQGSDNLSEWAKNHREFCHVPTPEELAFVRQIFAESKFRALVRTKQRLQGKPVADPFVIARAERISGCVVTQESRTSYPKIPHVCEHFDVKCVNLEGFMEEKDWTFWLSLVHHEIMAVTIDGFPVLYGNADYGP
jgi:hypothetical protein